jgi:ligand-binding sensor domain-containing protein
LTVYTKADNLYSDDVCKIVEDKKGLIWAAHYKAGISCFDGSKWVEDKRGSGYFQVKSVLTTDPISIYNSIIKIDSLNNIWFASKGGALFKYNGKEWEKLFHINVGSGNLEIYISKFHKNNIWMKSCTQTIWNGIGLNKYDLNTNKLTNLSNSNVYQIAEDNNGILWFLTDKGLSKYDDKSGYNEVLAGRGISYFSGFGYSSLLIDKFGKIWAGFVDGIYCIQDK